MTEFAAVADETDNASRAAEEKSYGFWLFLMSDAIMFALLFATYSAMIHNTVGGPGGHSLFSLNRAFAETVLLLASSTTFGLASAAINSLHRNSTLLWLGITLLLGAGFVGLEVSEFRDMALAGAGPDRSGYLSAFFTLVGTHGLHVSAGLLWIVLLGVELAVRGPSRQMSSHLHRLGLFWHFLDIIWIGIFSIVYLPALASP
jgi:cytochrome o ubiquinol oxidase subunit 3